MKHWTASSNTEIVAMQEEFADVVALTGVLCGCMPDADRQVEGLFQCRLVDAFDECENGKN